MNVSFQNTYISKRINNQFVTDPKTGGKELSVNILLRGFENTRNNQKQNFDSPKVRNFDVFDYIIASDKRKNGEKIEIDEDGRLIINMILEEYTEDGFRWVKDGVGWRMMSGFGREIYEHKVKWREDFNDRINCILKDNDIIISDNEKFTFSIDNYRNITVSGGNEEKTSGIERVLNEAGIGRDLFVHIGLSLVRSPQEIFGGANTSRSIDFGSNGLLDIYEPYGFGAGQTDWMDKFSTNKYTKAEIIGHHIDMFHYVNPSMNFWNTKTSYNQQVWKAYI